MAQSRGTRWVLLGILLVALGLRVGWLAADPHPYYEAAMAQDFGGVAQQVEQGRGVLLGYDSASWTEMQRTHRLTDPASTPTHAALAPLLLPGIPAVTAGVWKLTGDHFLPVLLLMVLLDVLNVWLVFLVGRRMLGVRPALVAAGLYAVCPMAMGFSHTLQDGTPTVTIVLLALLVSSRARDIPWWRTALLLGVVGGFGAYVRSNAMPFVVAAAVGLLPLLGWRRGMKVVAVSAACAYGIFLPWIVRDAIELHSFLPLGRTGIGQTLYEGLSPTPDDQRTYREAQAAGFSGPYGTVAYDDYLGSRFLAVMRDSPGTVVSAFFRHAQASAVLSRRGDEPPVLGSVMDAMGESLALLALLGLARSWRRWRELAPLLLVGLSVWASQWPFLTALRFSLAILPVQCLLAASVLTSVRRVNSALSAWA